MKDFINYLTRTSTIRFVLVVGVLTLTACFGIGLFFVQYPIENKEFISMFLVGLTNWASMIVANYYSKPTPPQEPDLMEKDNEQNANQ